MKQRAVLWLLFLGVIAVALYLRCGDLALRPLHNDEAINAFKVRKLWTTGEFRYDPHEYHGPTLYYASLPVFRVARVLGAEPPDEVTMRSVPLLFGGLLVLLTLAAAPFLGRTAALLSGLLLAVSPAFVYFSRYYIHEMLLVCFAAWTLLALGHYARRRTIGWAVGFGLGVGLMYATKETFVFNVAAMAVGLVAAWILRGGNDGDWRTANGEWRAYLGRSMQGLVRAVPISHACAAVLAAGVVSILLFTSFLTHLPGALDAVRTYWIWLERARGGAATPHVHPFGFYFERVAWFHVRGGPVWTEAAIVILAIVGAVWGRGPRAKVQGPKSEVQGPRSEVQAVVRRGSYVVGRNDHPLTTNDQRPTTDVPLPALRSALRTPHFLTAYGLALALGYSVLAYKTPWCLLGFYHAWIILAGLGAAAIGARLTSWLGRGIFGVVLVAVSVHLGWQSWRATREFAADFRNPHVYGHTSADIYNLLEQVDELSRLHPAGKGMPLGVVAPDDNYWPLPWYLRGYEQAGWWSQMPENPSGSVLVVASKLKAGLEEKSKQAWVEAGMFELRPRYFVELYVESGLWKRLLQARKEAR